MDAYLIIQRLRPASAQQRLRPEACHLLPHITRPYPALHRAGALQTRSLAVCYRQRLPDFAQVCRDIEDDAEELADDPNGQEREHRRHDRRGDQERVQKRLLKYPFQPIRWVFPDCTRLAPRTSGTRFSLAFSPVWSLAAADRGEGPPVVPPDKPENTSAKGQIMSNPDACTYARRVVQSEPTQTGSTAD